MSATTLEAPDTGALSLPPDPGGVLADPARFNDFMARIRDEIAKHTPDVSTRKGREEIASLAHRIARMKTGIDEAGKALNEDKRKQINVVDAARRRIRDEMDALKADVRKPLDEWEAAEEARVKRVQTTIDALHSSAIIGNADTAASVETRLRVVEATEITDADFGELAQAGTAARDSAIATLTAAVDRLRQQEKDAAELAQLRAEREARDAADRAAREAKEAAERAQRQAEAQAQAIADAADRARIAAEQKAERDRQDAERRHAEDLARAQREADAKIEQERAAVARAEAQRLADENAEKERADREAAAAKEAEERKANNARHRSTIMGAAKLDLMAVCGLEEALARKIVLAIIEGDIRHTSIKFGG